jgi:uncharacterized BrkB/YihY/UPF0761 family membrane protein
VSLLARPAGRCDDGPLRRRSRATADPLDEVNQGLASPELNESGVPTPRLEQWQARAMDALDRATERMPILNGIIAAAQRERATGGGLLAGGVAYRLFFWLVPLGLAGTALGAILGTKPNADNDLRGGRGIAGVVASMERQAIEQSNSARWYLLALGVGLSVWFGLGVVRALNVVYALAWGEKIRKVRRPLRAGACFSLLAGVLAVGGAAISAGVDAIGLGWLALTIAMAAVYGGAAFAISILFAHGDAPRRALVPGAIMMSIAAVGVHAFVNVYLAPKIGRSISTYGMLGAASVILLWLFIVARLITVSAFLNATLWHRSLAAEADAGAGEPAAN